MKKIMCKPTPEIELCIDGGESIILRFDVNALIDLQEMADGLNNVFKQSIPEIVALIIYAGAKNTKKDYTIEDARKLVCGMAPTTLTEIMNEFSESMGVEKSALDGEIAKNLMAQFLSQKMK